jgi:acyl-CoA thioesterase-1
MMSVFMRVIVAVFAGGVLQAKDVEHPQGVTNDTAISGNIFKVDLKSSSFELLKETAYDPKTDLEKSRLTVYGTEQTVITQVTEQTSFIGIKGPVITDFHGIDDKNMKALSEGNPFEARVAIVYQSAKNATGVAQDGRQVVSWFTPDEGAVPTSGTIEVNGKPVKVSLRKRNARLYVHAPLSFAGLGTGFWKTTLRGKESGGRFVIASMEVSPLADPRTSDDPKLPRVLVIGDSISMNYHEAAKAALKGVANYHRNEGNSFSTIFGVMNAELWLGDYHEKGFGWDVIQFNHGLHDMKQTYDAKKDTWGAYAVSLEEYQKNLEKEIAILKKTGAKLIWCSTTPVPNDNKGQYGRRQGVEQLFNQAALEVMCKHPEIQINDLHQVVSESPLFDDWRKTVDVHFYKEAEQKKLGEAVAQAFRKALGPLR